ncbi:hypothetical protein OHA18_41300 [Kribbella sp. NBC_00709]|uniref:hypothetical protein n=1 Tax=Kribbella sp. NBC_00709 TaxID=2975972 RepID=UPI002E2C979F|nr:hypothetical protein [Kribbella sp. NBC_00709]
MVEPAQLVVVVDDDDTARELTQHFAYASRAADARADAFFDSAGMQLLAGRLRSGSAAACSAPRSRWPPVSGPAASRTG